MPTIVQRVSNAVAQGTRWRATPNARAEKDQTIKISSQKKAETQAGGWITFSALHWITFRALQTCDTQELDDQRTVEKIGPCGAEVGDGVEDQRTGGVENGLIVVAVQFPATK